MLHPLKKTWHSKAYPDHRIHGGIVFECLKVLACHEDLYCYNTTSSMKQLQVLWGNFCLLGSYSLGWENFSYWGNHSMWGHSSLSGHRKEITACEATAKQTHLTRHLQLWGNYSPKVWDSFSLLGNFSVWGNHSQKGNRSLSGHSSLSGHRKEITACEATAQPDSANPSDEAFTGCEAIIDRKAIAAC